MGLGEISVECLVIVLYGVFPGHAQRRFDTVSGTF